MLHDTSIEKPVSARPTMLPLNRRSHFVTYNHVLVPTSMDPRERSAVRLGLQIAEAHDAKVTFLHVLSPAPVTPSIHWLDAIDNLWVALSRPGGGKSKKDQSDAIAIGHREMCAFINREANVDVSNAPRVTVKCRFGDVASEILRSVDQGDADLVILCCELSTVWPTWFSSRVRQVLQASRKQVVLVRPDR